MNRRQPNQVEALLAYGIWLMAVAIMGIIGWLRKGQ